MPNTNVLICSSLCLGFVFAAPGHADEHFPFWAEVSKESVNVRAGPNTNFAKVDKLSKGQRVLVLGRSYEWYKIQPLLSTEEYIRSDYLNLKKGEALGEVTGDNVNVRSAASADAASLGEVKKGTIVKVKAQAQGWTKLEPVEGTVAWVRQDFVQEAAVQSPAAVPAAVVSSFVSMRGKVEALVQAVQADVHYEIVMDDKSVFFLQDIPQIALFCSTVVDVEGDLVPDPQKKLMYPLLHIQKISLVV